jgi:hypothetical protein
MSAPRDATVITISASRYFAQDSPVIATISASINHTDITKKNAQNAPALDGFTVHNIMIIEGVYFATAAK